MFRVLRPDDECATVFVGSRGDPDQLKKCLQKEKDAKFSISYRDYINAKCAKETLEKESSARSGARQGEDEDIVPDDANDEDFDMSWLGKGRSVREDARGMY